MIYYSHVNEDNRLERTLLNEGSFSTVVAICGSGERVLSLMDNKTCKRLIVIDCNEEAIFLFQLKIAALTKLTVDDYFRFIGHHNIRAQERIAIFEFLAKDLPGKAYSFWQNNYASIKKGILHIGHYEKFLDRARPITNFWLGKNFRNIFRAGGQKGQFPAIRWKLLQQVFSYKIVYQLFGNRDIAFTGSSAEHRRIPVALNNIIQKGRASSSFMTHLVFKGNLLEMGEEELPPSLQKKVLAVIKDRLVNQDLEIKYHVEDLMEYLQYGNEGERPEKEGPVFYSLSDILSFADFNYLHAIVKTTAVNGNLIVGRSFLRNRLTTDQFSLLNQYGKVILHDEQESTGMYQVFSLKHKCLDAN